ncbi:uncharacterized protein F5891DRAFT_1015244 [Suillus fuscotomentosus]|uniref:Uncharacterized protein n=1 Tax=Suillus fuscotomentosus TaxID=1912939 RepID=A0AAD4ECM6_9AGAM|nr:uncharacterized protein F5891DRAFT_1015244 [Suillus fuscotomentosus]KAG1855429.1 hypothetical protein C8R48DRAFT_309150 [Suillus tomentosus]KAG1903820.1 hypothetical protein F5891DRAFT_1015244 [Suillus fuscotomentosus]
MKLLSSRMMSFMAITHCDSRPPGPAGASAPAYHIGQWSSASPILGCRLPHATGYWVCMSRSCCMMPRVSDVAPLSLITMITR